MAAQLGYCGLDRQRRPLQGDEIRPCWEAADAHVAGATDSGAPISLGRSIWPAATDPNGTTVLARRFVDVVPGDPATTEPPADPGLLGISSVDLSRWSLWGEVEA